MPDPSWFIMALVGPFLYAITNTIDKHLLGRFEESGVEVLILYSSLLSVLALPILWWLDNGVLEVDIKSIAVLCGVAALNLTLLWAYLKALSEDETTVVIVFYQLVPVLGAILGYFILGETLSARQLLGMFIIIVGTSVISFEMDEKKSFRWRKHTLGYMLLACLCWALETTLFKDVALEENVIRSLFWEHLVLAVLGVVIFMSMPSYRHAFLRQAKGNSTTVVSLNIVNEGLYMLGNSVVAIASLMAPVALILLGNSFQSFFVMLIGIVIAVLCNVMILLAVGRGSKYAWLAKWAKQTKMKSTQLKTSQVVQRLIAIVVTGAGTILLLT